MCGPVGKKISYFDDGDDACHGYGQYDDRDYIHDKWQHFQRPSANLWGSVSDKMYYYNDDGDAQFSCYVYYDDDNDIHVDMMTT